MHQSKTIQKELTKQLIELSPPLDKTYPLLRKIRVWRIAKGFNTRRGAGFGREGNGED
jgi:hypothetical protein